MHHFSLYQRFWKYNLADNDSASVRTGLVGAWKEFVLRCRGSAYAAQRDAAKQGKLLDAGRAGSEKQRDEAVRYVQAVEDFFIVWTTRAVQELQAYKPYRCQINALRYLEVLLVEGIDQDFGTSAPATKKGKAKAAAPQTWPFSISISATPTFAAHLILCVTSTYADIKETAYQLLLRIRPPAKLVQQVKSLAIMYVGGKRDAEINSGTLLLRLVATFPPGTALRDEVSGVNEVLALAEDRIFKAVGNFEYAAQHRPIHGYILALKCVQALSHACPRLVLTIVFLKQSTHPGCAAAGETALRRRVESSQGGLANDTTVPHQGCRAGRR
jgi:hypothetical protein